jgi:hypothetical protein
MDRLLGGSAPCSLYSRWSLRLFALLDPSNAKISGGMESKKGHKDISSDRCILMLDLFSTELHNNPCEVMTAVHI